MESQLFKAKNCNSKVLLPGESSKSTNSTPKAKNLTLSTSNTSSLFDFSHSPLNKSIKNCALSSIQDFQKEFTNLLSKIKKHDKDTNEIIRNCEEKLKNTIKNILQLKGDQSTFNISESESIDNISKIDKKEHCEYQNFLEYILAYEQAKNEKIVKQGKIPKIKLQEIDKELFSQFSFRPNFNCLWKKSEEMHFVENSKKEIEEIVSHIKENLKKNAETDTFFGKIDDDKAQTNKNIGAKNEKKSEISLKSDNKEKFVRKKYEKNQKSNEKKAFDYEKLLSKYTFLIKKINNQENKVKSHGKMIKYIRNGLNEIREEFLQFVDEIKFYISMISKNFDLEVSRKAAFYCKNIDFSFTQSILLEESSHFQSNDLVLAFLRSEIERLSKENENLKLGNQILDKTINNLDEKCKNYEKIIENYQLFSEKIEKNSEFALDKSFIALNYSIKSKIFDQNELPQDSFAIDAFIFQFSKIEAEKIKLEEKIKILNSKLLKETSEKNQLKIKFDKRNKNNSKKHQSCSTSLEISFEESQNIYESDPEDYVDSKNLQNQEKKQKKSIKYYKEQIRFMKNIIKQLESKLEDKDYNPSASELIEIIQKYLKNSIILPVTTKNCIKCLINSLKTEIIYNL